MASLDRIFDLLSKERRRYALYDLEDQDGPVSVDKIAEQVAEWESNGASASITEDKFKKVKMDLYHSDLPKASEVEYIQYDPEEGRVEVVGESPEFNAITSIAQVIERPNWNP